MGGRGAPIFALGATGGLWAFVPEGRPGAQGVGHSGDISNSNILIFWRSLWTIGVAGIVVVTSSPWSDWKASVRTQAYDASGPVSPLLSELLVHRRLRDAPGAEWLKDDSFDSGTAPTMHSFFTIPGGTTRWFNVMAHGISEVDYSFENSAFATCGMDVNVNLIVVERL